MQEYLVSWQIEISAESAREAAEKALAIQRDVDSIATVFHCYDENDQIEVVDLTALCEVEG